MAETTDTVALVIDASGAARGAAEVEKAAAKVAQAGVEIETATKRVADATKGQERFLDSLARKYDPAAAAAARFAKEQARLEGIIAGGGPNSARAAQALEMVRRAQDGLGDGADRAAGRAGRFGGAMQQVGFQVGDAATQISMGTNAFQAISVQAGQLLGAFGPIGAVLGAVAVAGGAVAAKFLEVEDTTEKAKKAEEALAEALQKVNDLTLTNIELQRRKTEATKASALATLAEQRAQAQADFMAAGQKQAAALAEVERQEAKYGGPYADRRANEALAAANAEFDAAFDRLQRLEQARKDLASPAAGSTLWEQQNAEKMRVGEEVAAQIEARQEAAKERAKEGAKEQEEAARKAAAAEDAAFDHRRALMQEEDKEREKREQGVQKLDQYVEGLEREAALLLVTAEERDRTNALIQAENIARQSGIEMHDADRARIEQAVKARHELVEAEKKHKAATQELERFGERAFDRIGNAMTTMAMQGQNAFQSMRNIGLAVVSELMQEFVKLAAINPIKNAIFGGNNMTFGDVFGNLFGNAATAKQYGTMVGSEQTSMLAAQNAGFNAYAVGTDYASPGLAIVGEQGPELVQMAGGERVYTADQTSRLLGQPANSNQIVLSEGAIVVNAPGASAEDATAIAAEVAQRVVAMAAPQIQRGAVQQSMSAMDARKRRGDKLWR